MNLLVKWFETRIRTVRKDGGIGLRRVLEAGRGAHRRAAGCWEQQPELSGGRPPGVDQRPAHVAGTWSGELLYGPWGATRYSYGVTPTSYRYTGQREEAAVGLYYYGARWYDPAIGRFIQPGTLVPDPANPQSLNRYAYTYNNSLRYTDPSGHCPMCVVGAGIVVLKFIELVVNPFDWTLIRH